MSLGVIFDKIQVQIQGTYNLPFFSTCQKINSSPEHPGYQL